jgi:hypothetical protein
VPTPPPKLKSSLPVEQGAWVAWQHGESSPPVIVLGTLPGESFSPTQRMVAMQRRPPGMLGGDVDGTDMFVQGV